MLPLLASEHAVVYHSEVGQGLFHEPEEMLGRNLPRSLVAYLSARRADLAEAEEAGAPLDCDLAMRLVRLGHEGTEALHETRVTLPVAEPLRTRLRQISVGEVSVAELIDELDELIARLETAPFCMQEPPVELDYQQWLIRVYREHWEQTWRPAVLE